MATSRAVAAVKRAKVVEAVADGATYEQAAQQAGYATRSHAYKAFWKAVDGRQAERWFRRDFAGRDTDIQRVDPLDRILWSSGDAAQCDLWSRLPKIPLEDCTARLLPTLVMTRAHSRFTLGRMIPTRRRRASVTAPLHLSDSVRTSCVRRTALV